MFYGHCSATRSFITEGGGVLGLIRRKKGPRTPAQVIRPSSRLLGLVRNGEVQETSTLLFTLLSFLRQVPTLSSLSLFILSLFTSVRASVRSCRALRGVSPSCICIVPSPILGAPIALQSRPAFNFQPVSGNVPPPPPLCLHARCQPLPALSLSRIIQRALATSPSVPRSTM